MVTSADGRGPPGGGVKSRVRGVCGMGKGLGRGLMVRVKVGVGVVRFRGAVSALAAGVRRRGRRRRWAGGNMVFFWVKLERREWGESEVGACRGFVGDGVRREFRKNFALGDFWEFPPLLIGKTTFGAGIANARSASACENMQGAY